MPGVQAGVQSGATASAVVGAMNVLGTVVAASAMDRAGRKQLLRLSFGGMGVAMLAMVAGLSLSSLAHLRGSIALFGTLAYVLTFSLGAGPVPGLLVPEITPARLRGMQAKMQLCKTSTHAWLHAPHSCLQCVYVGCSCHACSLLRRTGGL